MQRLKEAAPEHVRWRSPTVVAADPAAVTVACVMRAFVREWAQGKCVADLSLLRGTGDPGSDPDNFLAHVLKRSLGVLGRRDNDVMQFDYSELLTGLPDITIDKVGPEQLATTNGRAFAIGQLVSKHRGEIVELDHGHRRPLGVVALLRVRSRGGQGQS